MKGVSPIVSTILMVAIAIAAAVVVYYITMNVLTQQGAQVQEQASSLSNVNIIIQAAELNTADPFNLIDKNDTIKVYYTLSGANSITDLGKVRILVYKDLGSTLVCDIDKNLEISADLIEYNNSDLNYTINCYDSINENNYYYLRLVAGTISSNYYKVKAK